MTDPQRPRRRAIHRLAPGQRIKPALAVATVGALFSAELLQALRQRGLLAEPPAPPAAEPARAAPTA